ncbi:MAG: hypothetical protein R2932_58960 [Caldilineaceae bacterium]
MSRFTMFALLSVVTALLLAGCAASPIVIVTAPGDTFQVTTSTVYTHRLREVKPVLGATAALVRTGQYSHRGLYHCRSGTWQHLHGLVDGGQPTGCL